MYVLHTTCTYKYNTSEHTRVYSDTSAPASAYRDTHNYPMLMTLLIHVQMVIRIIPQSQPTDTLPNCVEWSKQSQCVMRQSLEIHLKRLLVDALASTQLLRGRKQVLSVDVRNSQAPVPTCCLGARDTSSPYSFRSSFPQLGRPRPRMYSKIKSWAR